MNVLLTCAGRRNYLITAFREALQGRGCVYAADCVPDAPALQEADQGFILPELKDAAYDRELLRLCKEQQIGLLVPLNDLELPRLATLTTALHAVGTISVVSSPEVIHCCSDKLATDQFLSQHQIPSPQTYLALEEVLEQMQSSPARSVIVKPRWGSGSIGIQVATNPEELRLAYHFAGKAINNSCLVSSLETAQVPNLLIQERVTGPEYGLDVINDLQGRYVTTLVKRKLSMRAGETDRAVTVHDPALEALGQRLGQALGHVGNLDCDVIVGPDGPRVIELNPRFGGSYPFSHQAGANLPAALLAWARGEAVNPAWLRVRPNITSAKCDRLVECSVP
jgi:carbamoyl-phosphate synthase large subunit